MELDIIQRRIIFIDFVADSSRYLLISFADKLSVISAPLTPLLDYLRSILSNGEVLQQKAIARHVKDHLESEAEASVEVSLYNFSIQHYICLFILTCCVCELILK